MTTACRGCGTPALEVVLSLGDQPLANSLLTEDMLGKPEPRHPLDFAVCASCGLAQIMESVAPESLFREYVYFSSVSDAFVEHSRLIAERLVEERGLDGTSLVVELASNDGYLLQHYARRGVPVLGVEPAENVAVVARDRGIPTVAEFFDLQLGERLADDQGLADVVHANNVIAHVPDIHGFVGGIARVLKPTGIAVIETPYVRELVERLEFDTIYHEHVFYHSLTALSSILDQHGLDVIDVEHLAVHGGSLRLFAAPRGSGKPSRSVDDLRNEEARLGIVEPPYFRDFAARVTDLRSKLLQVLAGLKKDGRTLAAYGAAAKGTVLLNAFGIGTETLEFVADRSPHKHGRYMPGVRVPIVPAERLLEAMPDACLLLAWNFSDEIMEQQSEYLRRGGRFIVPVPEPRIVGLQEDALASRPTGR